MGTPSVVLGLTPTIVVLTFRQLWPIGVKKTPKNNTNIGKKY